MATATKPMLGHLKGGLGDLVRRWVNSFSPSVIESTSKSLSSRDGARRIAVK